MSKTKRFTVAIVMLLVSATLLTTASFAWFALNTRTTADGLSVEAYTDSLFLEISQNKTEWLTDTHFDVAKANLLLATASLFKTNSFATISTPVAATGNYKSTDGISYYERVESKVATGKYNYIDVTATLTDASATAGMVRNPVFTLVTEYTKKSGTFYEYDTVKHTYTEQTITDASAYGLYTMTSDAETATYETGSSYYKKNDSGVLSKVEGLALGSDLSNYFYFTTAPTTFAGTDTAATGSEYYLVNGKDYSYIGAIPAGTPLKDYLFFGTAYSSDAALVDETQTLNVIGSAVANQYYLTKTLYLQCAEGTNMAENLVIDVTVGGEENVLSDALRVLFVATTSADKADPQAISAAIYDAGLDTITYSNGANLFDTILGNEAEQITVDVYIYFDGLDDVASNKKVASGALSGQTIELEFAINGIGA